ncbi:putative pentatricopeptide [Medicago truncatula]|uniref:PPR containing plant-like protein n=1 Tax=Medicago truncatula TaxID=3880 RepID=A0A072UZ04_MEDTR|nr:pentatricopeptide repeat-containing protein At1g77360, mitochondrial [Medicago truncatula]KEH34676.1 PPR containing plant-like protein [Medicago truncatula]RHN68216.1 putative pentatricopeptide [Medicago truncatula]
MNVSRKRNYHSISSPSPPKTSTHSPIPIPPLGKTKTLFEIISTNPSLTVEKSLEDSQINLTPQDVENVLKLSYRFPAQSVKFFRWAGHRINHNHTPYAWNLVIDILGKNCLFDAMWDAVKSMRREGLLSRSTFASIFASYVNAGRLADAIMTFEVMDGYGVVRDVVSLNSLLSAVCGSGRSVEACDYLQIAKKLVRPDSDTYAILMEGLESDGNVVGAKETFAEMVIEIGWDPGNVAAYDSFLCCLIKGSDGIHEAVKFFDSLRDRRCYPGIRFFRVALDECSRFHDIRRAEFFWEVMMGKTKLQPMTAMYNSMIALYCYHGDIDAATKMLDGMVCKGAFPDSLTYNLLFRFLVKGRKLRDATRVFVEMVKNECVPDQLNCDAAVRVYLDNGDPVMAIKVWKCLVENYREDLEGTANLLVVGLRDNDRVPEAVKYAEHIIGRGIKLTSSTLSKLRQSLVKDRKEFVYDELIAKWKAAY